MVDLVQLNASYERSHRRFDVVVGAARHAAEIPAEFVDDVLERKG
jgi:hypothetical protein